MRRTTLILFTASYPYSNMGEYTFIGPEVPYLQKQFDQIWIVPSEVIGEAIELQPGLYVEPGLAVSLSRYHQNKYIFSRFSSLFTKIFWEELTYKYPVSINPMAINRLMYWLAKANQIATWTQNFISGRGLILRDTLFYTYWFEIATVGIALLKSMEKEIKLISRAHGYDYIEERRTPAYIPLRRESFQALEYLFMVSNFGKTYLTSKYPDYFNSIKVSSLGVPNPGSINHPSSEGVCRIVSCSNLIQLKRVDLLLQALLQIALRFPNQKFDWQHFGSGPIRNKLEKLAKKSPHNLNYKFWGQVNNRDIITYYMEHPVDVFISTSASEGGRPVSIMEAQSFGIPVVATSVGGSPEIVNNENGLLLPKDPSPREVADAIWQLYSSQEYAQKRKASRENWLRYFNAESNYKTFAKQIRSMLDE